MKKALLVSALLGLAVFSGCATDGEETTVTTEEGTTVETTTPAETTTTTTTEVK